MRNIYTVFDKNDESIAIVHKNIIDKFLIKTKESRHAYNYKKPESLEDWYYIKQGKTEMYVSDLKYASSFLKGEFKADRIRKEQ